MSEIIIVGIPAVGALLVALINLIKTFNQRDILDEIDRSVNNKSKYKYKVDDIESPTLYELVIKTHEECKRNSKDIDILKENLRAILASLNRLDKKL